MGEPIRVMLVDDDSSARFILRTLLGDHPEDFTIVAEVGLASDAVECLAEARPDVALLDARMPMTSGYELARLLLDARPDIRLILLSAMVDEQVRAQARAAGIHACLDKKAFDIVPQAVREVFLTRGRGGTAGRG